jgi:hypothetical protein
MPLYEIGLCNAFHHNLSLNSQILVHKKIIFLDKFFWWCPGITQSCESPVDDSSEVFYFQGADVMKSECNQKNNIKVSKPRPCIQCRQRLAFEDRGPAGCGRPS